MKKNCVLVGILIISLMLTGLLVQAGRDNYSANLSGDNEVPANDSNARGQALFQFSSDDSTMMYKLIVANIENVLAAHIHCAEEGVNGPVGVTLYGGPAVTTNGILAEETVAAPNAGNQCGWTNLADVRAALESGNTYVNVHTSAIPSGEIRGQIK